MTKGRRTAAWLLLAAALGLAILGQFYFFHRRDYLWDGLVFHGLAALCFLLAWRLTRPPKPRPARRSPSTLTTWLRRRPVPAALLTLGLALSLAATLLSWNRPWNQATNDVTALWLLGMGAVGMAAFWPAVWPPFRRWERRSSLRAIPRDAWLEATVVVALTALAFLLRATELGRVPFTLGGDEAWHGLLARQVLAGQLRNPFVVGYMSMPTLFYWPLSWSLWLVGDTMVGARSLAALVGAITIPALYLFARDLWGRRTALLGAAFLAAYDYHIHYSRLVANNVWDPLLVVLTLWLLNRGLAAGGAAQAARQTRFALLTGLAMGLGFYFYTGARLLPLLVVVYLAFLWMQKRLRRSPTEATGGLGWRLVLLLASAFLIAAGPMIGYALSHPNEWNARINQVGIIQSGWLARELGLTGKSAPQILAEQFLRAAGAFHVFPDRTVWYGADRPLLGVLAGVFAVWGMAWAVAQWRERRYFLVLAWFWAVVIAGGMLTESPPSSQRLVMAIPTVALLAVFGLEQTVVLARKLLGYNRLWENVILGVLILFVAASSVRFYFVEFTPTRRYGSENGETATLIGHYLRGLEGDYPVYFFGAPRISWRFGTMTFLAPRVSGQDVADPLTAPPDFVDKGRGALFIFLPERVGELAWVQQAFPNGHLQEFYVRDRLRFIVYTVPPPPTDPQPAPSP